MKIPGDAPYDNPTCNEAAAYWFYRPKNIPDIGRTLWIMGFSYERGAGEMLESYGHRVEGILSIAVAGCSWLPDGTDDWSRFTWLDKNMPGQAQCGNIHYGPNSLSDYEWANPDAVPSACDDWYDYPDLAGNYLPTSCEAWGCSGYDFKKWWLGHLPRAAGDSSGILNNWWRYVAAYDDALP